MLTIKNPKTFDWANMSLADCCEGNAYDTYFTLKLYFLIEEKLEELGMTNLVDNLIMPSLGVFSEMEHRGMLVDEDQLESIGHELFSKNIEEEDTLYSFPQVNSEDNLSSNNTLIEILYTRESGFALYPPDLTAKGKPSVSAPTLSLLVEQIEEEIASRG